MDACAQATISAGEPLCSRHGEDRVAHAFGAFSPFLEWREIDYWEWGGTREKERLFSLRFDVVQRLQTIATEVGPSSEPMKLPVATSTGALRLRICASRQSGRLASEFFVDASGVDVYAQHVRAELWAPRGVDIAREDSAATRGSSLGVLDAVYAPSVTRIGSSLRGVGTLHTYAEAGVTQSVPPRAVRYAVLSGEAPTLTAQGFSMADAPAEGPVGGADTIQVDARSVIAWEVAP